MKTLSILFCLAGSALILTAQTNAPADSANAAALPGTNAPAAPPKTEPLATRLGAAMSPSGTNNVEHPPTEIFSDTLNMDLKSNIAVYMGHVRVVDPQMKMTCGLMTVHMPKSGQIDNIDAEENVIIDAVDSEGKPIHATGERAVYRYRLADSKPSETIELTGMPRVEQEGGWLVGTNGTVITWDRINNSFGVTGGQHMVILAKPGSTNSVLPAAKPEKKTP